MASTAEIEKMTTLFLEIYNLYLKCYKDTTPHKIQLRNASNYIQQLLATCDVITVRRNDLVVGVVIYQLFQNVLLGEKEVFIHEWFIHPSWRKTRVAYETYKEIIKKGKELGCTRLRGMVYNPEMIHVVKRQKEAKATALMFEREL